MGSPLTTDGFFNTPLAAVVPFTYRDNESYLGQIKRLKDWIDSVVAILAANIAAVEASDTSAITSLANQLNDELNEFVAQWTAELINIQDQSPLFILDPTNGKRTETANVVVGNLYNYLRYYAFFADQLDSFGYTVAEWDAYGYTARGFDLALAYNSNQIQATNVLPVTVPIFVS